MIKFLNRQTQKMSAAVVTGAMIGAFSNIESAQATGKTLNDYLQSTSGNVNKVPDLVAFLSYLGGTALAALGVVNLKQHVENPSQTPMKNGLAKLGFGGMLLALPTITENMMGSVAGGGSASYEGFSGTVQIK